MKKSFVIAVEEKNLGEYFQAGIVDALNKMEVDEDVELIDGTVIARTE